MRLSPHPAFHRLCYQAFNQSPIESCLDLRQLCGGTQVVDFGQLFSCYSQLFADALESGSVLWSDTIKPHTQGAIIIRERVLQMGQKYNAEYKADVLKMAEEIGVSAACRQLGISSKTVYNWRRAERIAKGEIRGVQPGETPEQAVVRLTREIRELQEANYILRKALGFMAGR